MACSAAVDEVYARQLLPRKRGYPIFVPEPSVDWPRQFIDRGEDVGDVGFIVDGLFFFVFSLCAPADDPVNCHGVPDGYPNMHKKGFELTSSSIKQHDISVKGGLQENELAHVPAGVDVKYTLKSSSSEAAVLNMPDGACSIDYWGLNKLRSCAMQNGESWYEFIIDKHGMEAPNGSLYLVTGCDKSTTWGITAVSRNLELLNEMALRFTAAPVFDIGFPDKEWSSSEDSYLATC
ncbi:hypothetical protein FIBSPDRAFT_938928 [Athelia psychrophila]|uniref:Uncharacterized protein n=1 Tax=Athelia psychrophila TaxID=1759441 RepID=A0A165XJ97_9AGAM|nr:hypothetical protein FIBSPDRAFT_938928 [Fibularhizoctonia sp. CBS 109695]